MTTRATRLAALAALTSLTAACWVIRRTPHLADVIQFSHAQHLEKADLGCVDCHAGVERSTDTATHHVPDYAACARCHPGEHETTTCEDCHSAPQAPAGYEFQGGTVRFDHAAHLERIEGLDLGRKCSRCHLEVASSTTTLDSKLPQMAPCLQCHEHRVDMQLMRCDLCHESLPRELLRPAAPFSHEAGFVERHRTIAAAQPDVCLACHATSQCADCHARTTAMKPDVREPERPEAGRIHFGNFLSRHADEARLRPQQCVRCHEVQSFCGSCHDARQLSAGAGVTTEARSPHPPGYAAPGSSAFHGPDARARIVECATCHRGDAADPCISCHRVGGIGGSPHPSGWDSRLEARGTPLCRACH